MRVSLFVIIFLTYELASCDHGWEISHSSNDDLISRTDYLITIYSLSEHKPCFYFSENRFSQPESSLINCTWYKSNACCKRTEVASVFLSMFTLNRASEHCMNLMNYMMCYFCSPDQYIWYKETQVSICLNYCDSIYNECKTAEYDGKTFEDFYKNGTQFCESQDFRVVNSNQQCFDFDSKPFNEATKLSVTFLSLTLAYFLIIF